jgi:hypothetical protein
MRRGPRPGTRVGTAVASIGLIWVAGAASPASATGGAGPVRYGIDIQATYQTDGNPELTANFSPNGSLATPTWSICRPQNVHVCASTYRKSELQPGPTSPGTVFQASARFRGHTYVGRSAVWQGTVRAVAAPRLEGVARYRARVIPHKATWVGGWKPDPNFKPPQLGAFSGGHGPDSDGLSVEACRTRNATRCVTVNIPNPVVGRWLTGQYLFAFDQRFAYDTVFASVGYGPISPPVPVSATVARSVPIGPVIGPPAPSWRILRRARRRGGRILVARVRCLVRPCRLVVWVGDSSSGSSHARMSVKGSALVTVPGRHLRPGPLDVLLYLGDYPGAIFGTSRLPPPRSTNS